MTTLGPQRNDGFEIRIIDDIILEEDEPFMLTLTAHEANSPPIVIIDQPYATIVIVNDDGELAASFSDQYFI